MTFLAGVFSVTPMPSAVAQVLLPGTQPEENGIKFGKLKQCTKCHANTKNGEADPYFSWQGGMMANAMRDPVFRATLAVANQDIAGVGEFCNRCHAPRGWLEGRSSKPDGSSLNREDLHGVRCDVCHRFVDPLSDEAKQFSKDVPPGYGNAMMVADTANVMRGPYGDGVGTMPHKVKKSDYHASGQLCGVCHNVSNPTLADDVFKQPPYEYGHVERTFSEWLLSDYSKKGRDGSCQSCHYKTVDGGGQASRYGDQHRDHFVVHGPTGGSTWVQDAAYLLFNGEDMSRAALDAGKKRARALLKTAATVDASFSVSNKLRIRITNLTGHKLPTGYPEGRRMWVNVRFLDRHDEILTEIGEYGEATDVLSGETVSVSTLLNPSECRLYESKPGLSDEQAKKHGKKPGASFHFVLNDVITKDNRIPPRGFTNASYAKHLCAPVGAEYEDGQYWDEFELAVPDETVSAVVRLMYQSVSWEYIKFLAEENRSDNWGTRLYSAWQQTGRCPPEVIAEARSSR